MENTVALDTLRAKLSEGSVPAKDKDFVSSLVTSAATRGLSPKQWYWVVTLAERMVAPPPEAKKVSDFGRVYAMFAKAKEHLKYPKVTLSVEDSEPIKLYVSGERSRIPDTVNVVGLDTGTWYGRVYADGRWETGHSSVDRAQKVEGLLTRLAADPEAVATEYGRLTGNCCFCVRKLSDERSTAVGYGPVCADHFGLDWG